MGYTLDKPPIYHRADRAEKIAKETVQVTRGNDKIIKIDIVSQNNYLATMIQHIQAC